MTKKKAFNVTGPCIPALHYMVDTRKKIDEIVTKYVDAGEYFTMNRARQYGKTTTLVALERSLKEQYVPISISFEGFGSSVFQTEQSFIATFISACAESMAYVCADEGLISDWKQIPDQLNFPILSAKITRLAKMAGKKTVLMIDEVDKSSNNPPFLDFLGMLRDKYINRNSRNTPTFHSVILAGVHDIKNLKMKLRPEEKHSYNSPWNIAARFDVDMSFSAPEIATMLEEYEQEHLTGMDAAKVSERIYYYTSGYPFLVSLLCKTMDDDELGWTDEGVDNAEMIVVKEKNTLFDDVTKNLVNNATFSKLVKRILLEGAHITFEDQNPDIDTGVMYGILTKDVDNQTMVSNVIFETRIYNYFISVAQTNRILDSIVGYKSSFIMNGRMDMAKVLNRFAAFMKSEYRDEDGEFIEREGRLLFLGFLKPIINGKGHYVVEPETRGSRRMDVVVFYGGEEHIVELKIWHGEQAASEAYDQLTGYLHMQEQPIGYLLSFCDNRKSPREGKTFTHNGCQITEVIVAYRDKE
ncbi:MAG: AAA-like domain-containing protein [Raoultibacter sp.]